MPKLDIIQTSHLFQGLSTEQVHRVASISGEKIYEAGQSIFRQGDRGQSLYVLEEGKVILEMAIASRPERGRSPQATVAVIAKGEVFGWSALVEPHTLTLSAQAVDRCKVIAIDGIQLLELMDSDPIMGYEVMRRLSEVIASRLVHSWQMLLSERGLALLSQAHGY